MKNMYVLAAIIIMTFAACSDEKQESNNPLDYPAEIHGTIKDRSGAESRTTDIAWVNGDLIGVTTAAGISDLSFVVTEDRNVKYAYNSGTDMFEVISDEGEDNNIYFKGPYVMKMTAYYPYTGKRGELAGVINSATTADKQTAGTRSEIDYLFAEGGGSQKQTKVNFLFTHRMCQLVLSFKAGEGVNLNDITYNLKGIVLEGTFNTATGEASCKEKTEPSNISLHIEKATEMHSSLILFPQKLLSTTVLEVVMGGKTYAATFDADVDMKSGYIYTFNVTLAPQAMTIGPANIEDWTPSTEAGNDHYGVAGEAE